MQRLKIKKSAKILRNWGITNLPPIGLAQHGGFHITQNSHVMGKKINFLPLKNQPVFPTMDIDIRGPLEYLSFYIDIRGPLRYPSSLSISFLLPNVLDLNIDIWPQLAHKKKKKKVTNITI